MSDKPKSPPSTFTLHRNLILSLELIFNKHTKQLFISDFNGNRKDLLCVY